MSSQTYNDAAHSCHVNEYTVCSSRESLDPEELRANWEWLADKCGISGDVGDKRVIDQIIAAAKKKYDDMIESLKREDVEIPDLV